MSNKTSKTRDDMRTLEAGRKRVFNWKGVNVNKEWGEEWVLTHFATPRWRQTPWWTSAGQAPLEQQQGWTPRQPPQQQGPQQQQWWEQPWHWDERPAHSWNSWCSGWGEERDWQQPRGAASSTPDHRIESAWGQLATALSPTAQTGACDTRAMTESAPLSVPRWADSTGDRPNPWGVLR